MLVSNEKKEAVWLVCDSQHLQNWGHYCEGISQFLIYFFSAALPIHQKFIWKSPTKLEAWAEFIIQYLTFSSWDAYLAQQIYILKNSTKSFSSLKLWKVSWRCLLHSKSIHILKGILKYTLLTFEAIFVNYQCNAKIDKHDRQYLFTDPINHACKISFPSKVWCTNYIWIHMSNEKLII